MPEPDLLLHTRREFNLFYRRLGDAIHETLTVANKQGLGVCLRNVATQD